MNKFVKSLFLFCVLITTTNPSFSVEDAKQSQTAEHDRLDASTVTHPPLKESSGRIEGRRIADAVENSASLEKHHSKPLRSIFLGIYKNYKSTYLGNKTLTEYKQSLRDHIKRKQQPTQDSLHESAENSETDDGIVTDYPDNDTDNENEDTDIEAATTTTTTSTIVPQQTPTEQETKNKLSPIKKRKPNVSHPKANLQKYNVGPALNLSLDIDNSIVKVNLDGESLKELVTGRWLNDNSEEGRGKKYEMVTRILPLFILPFLIQSAIVPFLVTKLKLLLMKSILVGKLAIFLLIISAFRNSNKQMQTYEVAPSYWASEPSRRSELAASASNMAYNGYRVEGKPAAWVN